MLARTGTPFQTQEKVLELPSFIYHKLGEPPGFTAHAVHPLQILPVYFPFRRENVNHQVSLSLCKNPAKIFSMDDLQ